MPANHVSVSAVLERLQGLGARAITVSPADTISIERVAILDSADVAQPLSQTVVLLPGVESAHVNALIDDLRARGASAVVMKLDQVQDSALGPVGELSGFPVFAVDTDADWLQVGSLIEDLRRPSGVSSAVSPIARAAEDLFALANAIASTVGGATSIEDVQRRVIAYSTLPGQAIDDDRREGILGRQVPNVSENEQQYALLFRDMRVQRLSARPGALDRVAVGVVAGTRPLGSIWVIDADGSIGEEGASALERAAHVAALHLLELQSSADLSRRRAYSLLERVLDGDDDARLALTELAFDVNGPLAVVALKMEAFERASPARMARFVEFIDNYVRSRPYRIEMAVVGPLIYMLMEVPEPSSATVAIERLVNRVESWLQVTVTAALGPIVTKATDVQKARENADVLLLLASESGRKVITAAEMRSHLALMDLAALTRSAKIGSSIADDLDEADSASGTEYVRTLRVYFESRQDVIRAAGRLFIHPNTLRYRLNRLRDSFGIDLDRPDDVLLLWLTLRLRTFD